MYFFLTLLLVVSGIDRIDLAAGRLDFRLTPYIALASLFLIYFFLRFVFLRAGRYFGRGELTYILLAIFFCFSIFISVSLSGDYALSMDRYLLLLFNVVSAFAIIRVLMAQVDSISILVSAAKLGILVFFLFDIAQGLNFYFGFNPPGGDSLINIVPPNYGGIAIRPSGFANDMNLGAFVLVSYFFFINQYEKPGLIKIAYLMLCLTMLALTLSRSGILAFFVLVAANAWYGNTKYSVMQFFKFCLLIAVVALSIFALILLVFDPENYAPLFAERFSFSADDSGGIHLNLIDKGVDVFFNNPLFGAGFGASYLDLVDFFEFNPYSNYHSLFITSLAETGFFGFFSLMLILFLPLFNKSKAPMYGPLLLALLAFNTFYQTIASPFFWIILSYVWIYFSSGSSLYGSQHASSQGTEASR